MESLSSLSTALPLAITGTYLDFQGRGLKLNTKEDVQPIAEEVQGCADLETLCLTGNTFSVEACKELSRSLRDKKGLRRALWSDMFTGRLKTEIPDALEVLFKAVQESGATLVELDLSDNAFGPNGIRGCVKYFGSAAFSSLKVLKLNNNGLGITGAKMLSQSLHECIQRSKSELPFQLKTFICGRNRLEDDGTASLASTFALINTLEEIRIPQNSIRPRGFTPLCKALMANTGIKVLDLNDNLINVSGAKELAQVLVHLTSIEHLNVGDCMIGVEGAQAIADALEKHCPCLQFVDFSYGDLSYSCTINILGKLSKLSKLTRINLDGNIFSKSEIKELISHASKLGLGRAVSEIEAVSEDEEGSDEDGSDNSDCHHGEGEGSDKNSDTESEVSAEEASVVDDVVKLNAPPAEAKFGPGDTGKNKTENTPLDSAQLASWFMKTCDEYKSCSSDLTQELDKQFSISIPTINAESLVSEILRYLGLVKSEVQVQVPENLAVYLAALCHLVRQNYFPKSSVPILIAFLNRPDVRITKAAEEKHALMSALFACR